MDKNNTCSCKATILLKNGTLLSITENRIMNGGIKIEDGTSSYDSFDIGSAIINKLTISLNNMYDEFSDYDFTDAVITVWIGKQLSERMEWMKKGVYTMSDPRATTSILTLEALDNMSKFDTFYDGNLTFPSSLQTIVQYCCSACGNILLASGQFPNYSYKINENPFTDSTSITYRAIISYCAQISGCYARCNVDGNLELKWYNTAAFDGIINGGTFDKTEEDIYQTGVSLDGGNFLDYSGGDIADGGEFTEMLPYHHIYSFSDLTISTENVTITGIRVTASDSEDEAGKRLEGETYLCGIEGYVLHITNNPLIEYGKAKIVAEYLGGRIIGMKFRPFTALCLGDPSMEAGDAAVITDRNGNSYRTFLTNISYSQGEYSNISCDAEPAARHGVDRYREIEKIVAEIKKDSQQQLSSYAQYVNQMNTLAVNAMGYYETVVTQDDGSTIHYMHDKPNLADSVIVYKNSIDGYFWSKDGGKTWTGGIDKYGNAVMNVIAAIGVSADWIQTGLISDATGKNTWNLDTGELLVTGTINGSKIIGSKITGSDIEGAKIHNSDDSFSITSQGCLRSFGDSYTDSSGKIKKTRLQIQKDYITYATVDTSNNERYAAAINVYTSVDYPIMELGGLNGFSIGRISNNLNTKVWGALDYSCRNGNVSNGQLTAYCDFVVSGGQKSRLVNTKNYGERLLYAYETPTPYFGDIGTAKTNENGECLISIDDIFSETITVGTEYSVFLQKEGQGDIWVESKEATFFIVNGTSNLAFSWEIKAVQRDYEYLRLEDNTLNNSYEELSDNELEALLSDELIQYDSEMEELQNEDFTSISGN